MICVSVSYHSSNGLILRKNLSYFQIEVQFETYGSQSILRCILHSLQFIKVFLFLFSSSVHSHPVIYLKDVSSSTLRDLLTFMYTGKVAVRESDLGEVLKSAQDLGIQGN